jgi:hypothetical protein
MPCERGQLVSRRIKGSEIERMKVVKNRGKFEHFIVKNEDYNIW